MSEWTTEKKKSKYDESNEVFTDEKKQTKFSSIVDTAVDYTQDAGRLVKDAGSSAIATLPSLPEGVVNIGNMLQTWGGKQLGLYEPDKKAGYIDIPYLPSFDEAKAFVQSPTQGGAFQGAENMLSQGKKNEIKEGLLAQGIYPNSPEWKNKYYNAVYDALGMATNEYETGAGEFLSNPAQWFGMGFPFGKTASRISAGAGTLQSTLESAGISENSAMLTALGTDVTLSLIAGVRNPSVINRLNTSVKYALEKGSIKEAKELLQFANNNKIPLLGIEALAEATGDPSLIKLAKLVAQSDAGKKYMLGLNNRQLILSEKSLDFVNDFIGAGNIRYLDVTNNSIKIIETARDNLLKRINNVARKKGYEKFDANINGTKITESVYDTLINLSKNKSITSDRSKTILDMANQIKGKDQKALQELSQSLAKDIYTAKTKNENKMAGYLLQIKGFVDTGLKQIDGYETGNRVYQNLYNKIISPLDDATSPLNKSREATMGLVEKVLMGKQDHVSISRLSRELNKIDNKLFPELAQALFSEMLGNIRIAENMGGNIFKNFYGTSNKQKQVDAILRGVAEAQGKKPGDLIKGFKIFLKTMNATSKYAGGESITNFAKKTDKGMGSKLAQINLMAPLQLFDSIVANQNWDRLGKIITDPNSIDKMIRLSKVPAVLRNWQTIIAPMFIGQNMSPDGEAMQKKYENQYKGMN